MRIALVSEHASPLATIGGVDAGGQNVHVAALATSLATQGHDVTVFTRRDALSLPDRTTTAGGYAVEHVPAGPPTDIPKDELFVHIAAFTEHLRAGLEELRPDVVHAHFWMSGLAAVTAAGPLGIPVAQTFHALGSVKKRHQGDKDTSPPQRIVVEQQLAQTVDRVIATCSDEVAELTALGTPPRRVSVVPCGVDTTAFRPGGDAVVRGDDSPADTVLIVGRLVERKGIEDAIRALVDLPDTRLRVAGGPTREALSTDPEAIRLLQLAGALGVADRVELLGAVNRADMPMLYARADVVVCAPWYEPFGIVPLEAMACGRPVVGTAVGGLLDTIEPGVTGELVPAHRPDRLACAIRLLLEHPERRNRYAEAGRRRVLSHYDWDTIARMTASIYEDLVALRTKDAISPEVTL